MKTTEEREITAIPTLYRGVQFKSRLEAQTAVLLDKLGWAWEYERYSIILPSGTTFIPDFWLPGENGFVECRGYESERGNQQIAELGKIIVDQGLYEIDQSHYATFFISIGPKVVYLHDGYARDPLVLYLGMMTGKWTPRRESGQRILYATAVHVGDGKLLFNCSPLEGAREFQDVLEHATHRRNEAKGDA